jgi:hypothetical protein
MKRLTFTLLFSLLTFIAFSQTKSSLNLVIGKSYAYSQRIIGGTILEDDKAVAGNKDIRYKYTIFLETKGKTQPSWKTAWINGKPYQLDTIHVASPIEVGKRSGSENVVVISARKGYNLLQIETEPTENLRKPNFTKAQRAAAIVLQGTFRNAPVTYNISKVVALEPIETY